MKKILMIITVIFIPLKGISQTVNDFKLPDVMTGRDFSLSDHRSAAAFVLIFTSNTCPFSILYEDRIMELANQFGNSRFSFVLINPHAGTIDGEEIPEMIRKGQTTMNNLPYLADAHQNLTQSLNITKIPEAVVITPGPSGFAIVYRGAIDNNPQLPHSATKKHLENALLHLSGKEIDIPVSTRAVGCNVKLTN